MQKEGLQLPLNKKNNFPPKKDSPIIIKSRELIDSAKIINSANKKKNIYSSSYINYTSKIPILQAKELLLKKTRNKNSNEDNDEKNNEENLNNKKSSKEPRLQSVNKQRPTKLKINKANIIKDDKDIYLSKDVLTSTRYIKDEDIIDKPLIYDTQVFKFDKKKGNLENRIE